MGTSDSSTVVAAEPVQVGIDVSKDKLDVCCDEAGTTRTLANDAAGIAAIVKLLGGIKPAVIVVEATGGYERPLMNALLDASLPVALVHPGRVRHFAKGLGINSKTDRIDAAVLRRFGKLATPRLAEKASKSEAELKALVNCRRQLVVTRAQQSNRRGSTSSKAALRSIDAVIQALDKQIKSLEKQIRQLLDADDDFKHLDELLQTVPGVGSKLSATLAAELRELGHTDRRQVGALVGVAPFNHDSGKFAGKRAIRGGRTEVRCVLYMATLAAMRCNPVINEFALRLKKAGKLNKVRIVACMRKLLSLLNAMVRDGLTWTELQVVKNCAPTP
jgi:transposase